MHHLPRVRQVSLRGTIGGGGILRNYGSGDPGLTRNMTFPLPRGLCPLDLCVEQIAPRQRHDAREFHIAANFNQRVVEDPPLLEVPCTALVAAAGCNGVRSRLDTPALFDRIAPTGRQADGQARQRLAGLKEI